jgi:hypothetical protein
MRLAECEVCRSERRRRGRLDEIEPERRRSEAFARAPYLHPFNKPKLQASVLRALHFAAQEGRVLLWCIASDTPLTSAEEDRSEESVRAAKQSWLTYPETATAGLPGMLPLSRGLPLRFTQTVDAQQGACKHTPCELVDWQLHDDDAARLASCRTAEMTLHHIPRGLLVRIADERSGRLETYVVRPESRLWYRDEQAPSECARE